MRTMYTIAKKELQSYVHSPVAYIFLGVFWVLSSWLFFRTVFIINQASLRDYFASFPWIFLFLIPAITMKVWAEEKHSGTWEVLLTWPVTDLQAVGGKFLSSVSLLFIALLGSLVVPITISSLGNLDWGLVFANYAGALLLAAAYLAIGLWASSVTDNQITSFIIALSVSFLLFLLGQQFFLILIPAAFSDFFRQLSLSYHFNSIGRGVIDTRDILYYISVIGFFLYLNIRNLESRKW